MANRVRSGARRSAPVWIASGVVATAMVTAAPSWADGFLEFSELTEPQLFELFSAVGDELVARGVLPSMDGPTDAYAAWLVTRALGLDPLDPAASNGAQAAGPGDARYRIFGLRMADEAHEPALPPNDSDAGIVALVLFMPDNQIGRAGLLPSDAYDALQASGATASPTALFWRAEGVTDVTPQLFRAATNSGN